MRASIACALSFLFVGFVACSDDDGSNIVPNGPPGGGGSGGASTVAGSGGTGGGGTSGGGTGGSPVGGSGGAAGCTPVTPDAGTDAGLLDAGLLDAGADGGDPDASGSGFAGGVVSFASDVHPLFELKCAPCHVTLSSAGHNVGGELNQAYDDAVRISPRLVSRIDGGGMPPSDAPAPNDCGSDGGGQPGDPGCLTVAEVALVQAWIDQCYPR